MARTYQDIFTPSPCCLSQMAVQVLPPITYPPILAPCAEQINVNDKVMHVYLHEVLPGMFSWLDSAANC